MSRFFALLAFVLVHLTAHAEFSAPQRYYVEPLNKSFATANEACIAYQVYRYGPDPEWKVHSLSVSGSVCVFVVSYLSGAQQERLYPLQVIAGSCPENSTASGASCSCDAGYQENGGQCVKPKNCKFSDTASAGYFDVGTDSAGGPSVMACVGGCETIFDGSFPSGNALVGGKKHYYAQGSYIKTGRECAASDSEIGKGVPVTQIPPDTCAEGYVMGKVNGKNTCSKGGAAPGSSSDSKPDPNKATSSTNTEVKKDKDADGNDRETTTVTKKNADGSTSTETTVKITKGDGNGGTTTNSTTTTVTTGGSGKGSGNGSGTEGDDDGEDSEKGKCEKNSSDEGCGGAAASVDGKTFYTAKEKTFSGIFSKASTDLRGSGMGGAFTGFFNVAAGGSCPATTWHVGYVNADVPFDFMCQSWALNGLLVIKTVLLVIATFMAARIALE